MNTFTTFAERKAAALAAVLSVAVGMGCASGPPSALKAQLVATDTSISQAEQAGAAKAALPELQQAKDKRAHAEDALHDKNYDNAMRLARQAQIDAQYASRKSEAVRADRSVDEIDRAHETLREEVERKSDSTTPVVIDDKGRVSDDR